MADWRFGSVYTGTDWRFGAVAYANLGVRTVESTSGVAGATGHVVRLSGTWDASGKTVTLTDPLDALESITPSAQNATSVTFTVPTPFADASAFDLFNMATPYVITVDDAGSPVESEFTISAPAQPTYHYISSVTGSPWDESSIFNGSTLVNGDSAIVEVLFGAFNTLNSDGTWSTADPISFRAKGFNADGWSTSWVNYSFDAGETPGVVSAEIVDPGDSLEITTSEPVWVGSGGNGGFALTASGGAAALTYASGAGTDLLVYTIDREVDSSETATLAYVQPGDGFEGATGIDLYSISGVSVSNSSSTDNTAPTLDFVRIARDGDSITLLFNEAVEFGAGGNGGFALTASGGAVTMSYSSATARELTYSLNRTVADTETVTIAYTQPTNGVQDTAGNDLATLSGKKVVFFTSNAVAVSPAGKPVVKKTIKSVMA